MGFFTCVWIAFATEFLSRNIANIWNCYLTALLLIFQSSLLKRPVNTELFWIQLAWIPYFQLLLLYFGTKLNVVPVILGGWRWNTSAFIFIISSLLDQLVCLIGWTLDCFFFDWTDRLFNLFKCIICKYQEEIAGFNYGQILFIYGMATIGRSVHLIFFDNLWMFGSRYIRKGEFERLLIMPINPLFSANLWTRAATRLLAHWWELYSLSILSFTRTALEHFHLLLFVFILLFVLVYSMPLFN